MVHERAELSQQGLEVCLSKWLDEQRIRERPGGGWMLLVG
jgi:hypothetical protein